MNTITKQILISIAMVVVYVFISYNVITGLMKAEAIEGFSGIMLILVGLVALVAAISNLHKLFD